MQDYRDVVVWQRSHKLVLEIYKLTESFPSSEKYGLVSQMRRSACSIPMNIAEGRSKSSDKDFARYLDISSGSAGELDYHILLAKDLGMISSNQYDQLYSELIEIRKMLNGFRKAISKNKKAKS